MMTRFLKTTIFFITFVFFLGPISSNAQNDPKAKTILDAVSKKYHSFDAIKTDFRFILDNPQQGVKNFTQTGVIIVKPQQDKFRVTIYQNLGKQKLISQEIISDGKTQWSYSKKDNEIQVNDVDKSSEALNPAQIFTMYDKGYKYLYENDIKVGGAVYQVLELTPTDNSKSFFKIRLQISKATSLIYTATLFDKNGNKYTYILNSAATNYKGSDAIFGLNKKNYPGAELVDLR